ncbi:phosphohydrolase [Enterovibrio norvegicus]|uniref:phosphohydrolase n=1 Tax=Enterovibrio norvegicus TaxID=188144 RepID=UPI00352CAA05
MSNFLNQQITSDNYDDRVVIPALNKSMQIDMFGGDESLIALEPASPHVYFDAPDIELDYDKVIVFSSGGKDSIAALKYLLDKGYPKDRVELWHHLVDGREGSTLMDWTCIDDYCVKFAEAVGVPIFFSWLKGGFEGEMLKNNSKSHPHIIQTPEGLVELQRPRQKPGTRMKFPQVAASLQTRWCSSALKIEVAQRAITCQEQFIGKRILVIEGTRREESAQRSRYAQLEPHSTDTMRKSRNPKRPRHVDIWRCVSHLTEEQVWQLLADWRVVPPVPYRLGWSRSSCALCIFNGNRIWSTINHYWPERLTAMADYEKQFGVTISRKGLTVLERAKLAEPMLTDDEEALLQATRSEYTLPIFVPDGETWQLPPGAFGKESSGAS